MTDKPRYMCRYRHRYRCRYRTSVPVLYCTGTGAGTGPTHPGRPARDPRARVGEVEAVDRMSTGSFDSANVPGVAVKVQPMDWKAPSRKPEHVQKNMCQKLWLAICICFFGKSLSVEDFTSLLDQLLLVDTLLLGFVINMMTASTLGKSDFADRDAWSLELTIERNELQRGSGAGGGGLLSYFVVERGTVAVSFLFISLGLGLFVYLCLNLSEARESERIFKLWSTFFLIPVGCAYFCLFAGLYYFYECYNHMVEIIFPLYCTKDFFPTIDGISANGTTQIYDVENFAMVEIASADFDNCKDESFTYVFFELSFTFISFAYLILFLVCNFANVMIHTQAVEEANAALDPQISTLLANIFDEKSAGKYHDRFVEDDITIDMLPRLSYAQLRELGLSVGHAMELLDQIASFGFKTLVVSRSSDA